MAQRNWQGAEFFRFSALMCCQASALGRLLRVDTWTVSVRLHKPRNPGIAGWPGSSGGLVGLLHYRESFGLDALQMQVRQRTQGDVLNGVVYAVPYPASIRPSEKPR